MSYKDEAKASREARVRGYASGGRVGEDKPAPRSAPREGGGKASTVNVIVMPPGGQQPPAPPPRPPMPPPMAAPPMGPPGMPPGLPPGGPMGAGPMPVPPPGMNSGGRVKKC